MIGRLYPVWLMINFKRWLAIHFVDDHQLINIKVVLSAFIVTLDKELVCTLHCPKVDERVLLLRGVGFDRISSSAVARNIRCVHCSRKSVQLRRTLHLSDQLLTLGDLGIVPVVVLLATVYV